MAFEQETGTGSSTSNSYASVAQLEAYWTDRATDYTGETTANKQAWLILATEYIDNYYKFEGSIVLSTQSLEWPRFNVTGKGGYAIESDTIPTDLINATCFMAQAAKDGQLNQVDDGLVSQRIGPVTEQYNKSASDIGFPTANKLLKYFIISGSQIERVN